MTDIGAILVRLKSLPRLLRGRVVDSAFRERIILAVTGVNSCRYCSFIHTKAALKNGISKEEVKALGTSMFDNSPEDEVAALIYAQHWAETEGQIDVDARRNMLQQYGKQKLETIELVMVMIRLANLFGNTFDYVLYRISFGRLARYK